MITIEQKDTQIFIKIAIAVLVILSLFLVTKAITEITSWSKQDYSIRTLTVTAEGEALAVADIASFSFSVNEEGATSEAAQKKATEKINKALEYLKSAGVEEKDIKTENYSISPKYDQVAPCYAFDCPPAVQKIVGYTVSQTILVKVRDIDNTGKFLTELTQFGINSVSGISFTIDDEELLYAKAREEAITKAQQKVEVLAKDLGVRVGKVISFNEEGPNMPYQEYGMGGDAMMTKSFVTPQIPQGENNYTTRVHITYELK